MSTYSSRVVGLAKVAVDTTGGGGVDDTAILLLEEVGPSSLGDLVGTAEVDVEDGVPQAVVHVVEGLVTEDTGVVDDDVNAAKGVDGTLDDGVAVLGRSLDTNGLAASSLDLVDNVVGVDEIVDDEGGTSLGESQGVGAANTGASTGDEDDLAGVVNLLTLLAGRELVGALGKLDEVVGLAGVLGVLGEVDDLVPVLDDGAGSVGGVGLEDETIGTLPAELGGEATTDLVDAASVTGVALVGEDADDGDDVLGLEGVEELRREDGAGQARGSNGGNDVAENVVLVTLLGEGLGEANKGELGGRVVGLAKVAVETGGGGGVDDTAVLLLAEVRPGGAGDLVGTVDVDLHDEVPVLILEVLEAGVAEDAGVVDDDVDTAESLDGGVDDLVTKLDRVVVGDGLATGGLDFVDDDIGSLWLSC